MRHVHVAVICAALAIASACREPQSSVALHTVPGGDPERGELVITRVGCGGCHVIPGVSGANGLVGPPLTSFAERYYIAGQLVNEPDNLVQWIMNPQEVEPHTAMPDLGLSEVDARHVAAYLYTLRAEGGLGPPRLFPASWLRSIPGGSH